jgi:hypothetical protein
LLDLVSPARDDLRAFAQRARLEDPETTPLYMRLIVESTRSEVGFDFSEEWLKSITDLGGRFGIEPES